MDVFATAWALAFSNLAAVVWFFRMFLIGFSNDRQTAAQITLFQWPTLLLSALAVGGWAVVAQRGCFAFPSEKADDGGRRAAAIPVARMQL